MRNRGSEDPPLHAGSKTAVNFMALDYRTGLLRSRPGREADNGKDPPQQKNHGSEDPPLHAVLVGGWRWLRVRRGIHPIRVHLEERGGGGRRVRRRKSSAGGPSFDASAHFLRLLRPGRFCGGVPDEVSGSRRAAERAGGFRGYLTEVELAARFRALDALAAGKLRPRLPPEGIRRHKGGPSEVHWRESR